jgi:serine/threonine protein kinase
MIMNSKVIDEKYSIFVDNIQSLFFQENSSLFEKRNTVKLLEHDGVKYAVKSFKIPHKLNQIVYRFFRASKAQRSYENSVKLKELDINTPAPIGYIEFPTGFLFKESYYVSEFYDFDFEIRDVLEDETFEDRENILKKFVLFSYDLHNKGVYHNDYSPGNVIIKKVDGSYEFSIIDVNRMKFIAYDDDTRFKNLSRFSTTQNDLQFIALEYAKLSGVGEDFALATLSRFHDEHQKYLENKKKLKKLKFKKT